MRYEEFLNILSKVNNVTEKEHLTVLIIYNKQNLRILKGFQNLKRA